MIDAVPVIKKINTDQTEEGIEQLEIYILYPISSSYKIEIDASLGFNTTSMEFTNLDSSPALILWKNDSIIAVNQIPENMDGEIKINQSIDIGYNSESRQEIIIKFYVSLSDSVPLNNSILRKEGWIKLGWDESHHSLSITDSK